MASTNVQFSVATHIMTALGDHYGEHCTSTFLAESVHTTPSFVRKSISKLVKAGLVIATRGNVGYCLLSRPPAKINLLDIYRASEAPATFEMHNYPVEKTCRTSTNIKKIMGNVLSKAQSGFEEELAAITLADLVAQVRARSK